MSTELIQTETGLTPTIEGILQRAVEQNMDAESLERILAVYERVQAKRAQQEFNEAMEALQAKLPNIVHDAEADVRSRKGEGASYKYTYSSLPAIRKVLRPLTEEFGFSFSFDTKSDGKMMTTFCKVRHRGGHEEISECSILTQGMPGNSAQQSGSANSYGKRYALCNAFGIVTADTDDDGQSAVVKQHDNPDRDESAPKTEPRSSRPSKDAIAQLAAAWREKTHGDEQGFREWIHGLFGMSRDKVLKVASWDSETLRMAWETLDAMPEPQLKDGELPF